MALSTTSSRVQYNGDNSTTVFTVPFEFFNDTDLQVFSTVIATGVSSTLVLNTDYTLTGAGVGIGGTLTMISAPASTVRITIARIVNLIQASIYNEDADFPVKVVEGDFDYSMMTLQQQADLLSRSFQIPITDPTGTIINIPNSVERANKVLSFDGAGNVAATVDGGYYRGNYVPGTGYFFRDLFADQMTGDIYFTLITYTAVSIAADLAAGNISLLFAPGNYAVGNPFNIAQYSVTTGTANAYVIGSLTNYTYNTPGAALTFQANFTNTGAATLNVNSLGDTPILGLGGNALTGGEIQATSIYYVVFDGANFNLINPTSGGSIGYAGATTGSAQAYVASIPGFEYVDGRVITFVPNFTNVDYISGGIHMNSLPTLNVNSLGATPLLDSNGLGVYTAGIIKSGIPYTAVYVGGNFYLQNIKNGPVYIEYHSLGTTGGGFSAGTALLFTTPVYGDYGQSTSLGAGLQLFNGSTFTAPYAGNYLVTASIDTSASTLLNIFKNGSSLMYGGAYTVGTGGVASDTPYLSATVRLAAADTLTISTKANSSFGAGPNHGFLSIAEIR